MLFRAPGNDTTEVKIAQMHASAEQRTKNLEQESISEHLRPAEGAGHGEA